MNQQKRPKVTIGLPVFNGEKYIKNALDAALSQSFTDFELIISDNGSTDSTPLICNDYAKRDKRIFYFRHEKNNGGIWNFLFVLEKANCEYFTWLSADDIWYEKYLEKNLQILESDKKIVGCASKFEVFGANYEYLKHVDGESTIKASYKKLRRHFRNFRYFSIKGDYEKKIRSCFSQQFFGLLVYSIFRTEKLRESVKLMQHEHGAWERQTILSIIKFGDIHVIDEILWKRYDSGISTKSNPLVSFIKNEIGFKQLFIPKFSYTVWCWNHLGKKNFLRNLDYFIKINLVGPLIILLAFGRLINKFKKKTLDHQNR